MKTILLSTIASLSLGLPAMAEVAVLSAPLQAASLHTGALDMAAYRITLPDGAHEVTAMFRGRDSDQPQRIVMRLQGRDEVRFAMPDEPQTLYTFTSTGNAVEISAQRAPVQLALR
ncbi:hypothetical protein PANO111632_17860 [Paracoccus nototheniae]|uniref:Copper resistance protein CopC n=1 Tax=Paracoccus nototheniae TaxID=2489002 RepID=A0ABW4E2V4_9RHOB|nr:hypothetical protein [Paracoccus nototheniae]